MTKKSTMCLLIMLWHSWGYCSTFHPKNEEYVSPDKECLLKVIPSLSPFQTPGNCRAEFYAVTNAKQKLIWSRYLINDYAPGRVFVANTGHVVTIGEWRGVGANHTDISVYAGDNGRLIKSHTLQSLGLPEYKTPTKMYRGRYANVIAFFDPSHRSVYVKFHWTDLVCVCLQSGLVIPRDANDMFNRTDYPKYGDSHLKELVLELLNSETGIEQFVGALYTGQLKLQKGTSRLRALLLSNVSVSIKTNTGWIRKYFVREAAKEALEALGEKVGGVTLEEVDSILQTFDKE